MGEVVKFARKRVARPITINGVSYVSGSEFAKRVGVDIKTIYQWNSENKIGFGIRYLGRIYFEEKAIDPFMRSMIKRR